MSGIHWLRRRPGFEAAARWLQAGSFAFVVVVVFGCLFAFAWVQSEFGAVSADAAAEADRLGILILALALITVLLLPLVRPLTKAMKRRLGTDGSQLYIRLSDGRQLVVPPERVVLTGQQLLYRQYSLPLRNKQGKSLYEDGELEKWLDPLLPGAARLDQAGALKHQWEHRDPALVWPLISALAIALVGALAAVVYLAV